MHPKSHCDAASGKIPKTEFCQGPLGSIQLNALPPRDLRTTFDQPDDGVGRFGGRKIALGVGEVDQEVGRRADALDPIEHG